MLVVVVVMMVMMVAVPMAVPTVDRHSVETEANEVRSMVHVMMAMMVVSVMNLVGPRTWTTMRSERRSGPMRSNRLLRFRRGGRIGSFLLRLSWRLRLAGTDVEARRKWGIAFLVRGG